MEEGRRRGGEGGFQAVKGFEEGGHSFGVGFFCAEGLLVGVG